MFTLLRLHALVPFGLLDTLNTGTSIELLLLLLMLLVLHVSL